MIATVIDKLKILIYSIFQWINIAQALFISLVWTRFIPGPILVGFKNTLILLGFTLLSGLAGGALANWRILNLPKSLQNKKIRLHKYILLSSLSIILITLAQYFYFGSRIEYYWYDLLVYFLLVCSAAVATRCLIAFLFSEKEHI